jgi:hypothetical protein
VEVPSLRAPSVCVPREHDEDLEGTAWTQPNLAEDCVRGDAVAAVLLVLLAMCTDQMVSADFTP